MYLYKQCYKHSDDTCYITVILGGPGTYQVVKCGPSGHNIRCSPNLKASPIGMIQYGHNVDVSEDLTNTEGTWIKLDDDSKEQYCHDLDG